MLTFGSLFAGIEGFGLGFHRAGLVGSWAVELETDCRSVIQRHFPSVELHADVRKVGKANLAPVDVLCGGFPCQDLSEAGKRGGLEGKRSGLFWEMVRVIDELRPRYVVWENVGGLASSDSGRDFARILRGLADVGYFGAVRLVDARWYGVPQRRRRYFGVFARCDSGTEWRRACEVLAVGESLQRHPAESGKRREDVAACITRSAGHHGHSSPRGDGSDNLVAAKCITTGEGRRQDAETCTLTPTLAGTLGSSKGRGWCDDTDRATFIATDYATGAYEETQTSSPLTCGTDPSRAAAVVAASRVGVRRMTPLECERVQGFPDGWTEQTHNGKRIKDGRRYAMIGNSVVPQVAEWIGRRLMSATK